MPFVWKRVSDGPKKYSDAITGLYSFLFGVMAEPGGPRLDFDKEPEFLALNDYVQTQPRLRSYFIYDSPAPEFSPTRLRMIVGDLLDRYIHINNTLDLKRDEFMAVYLPMEKYLFEETLPIVVIVPILLLKFDMPKFRIDDFVWVEELSDEIHLARGWHDPWASSDNSLVESAATHALFISGGSFQNHNWMSLGQVMTQLESYPVEMIDTFFAALRISTGCMTGYAQLLALPVGWASGYTADLTPLDRLAVIKYPPFFERGAWASEVPTVSSNDADTIRESFEKLNRAFGTNHGGRVRLAMHRLNLSAMRTTEEDGVLDAMIAMEALLSDGPQEMTHKVAMRLGALYKIADPARSEQAFREMKRIYTFRSKIVHGDADLDKYREVDRDGSRISAVDAAVDHLRTAFAVLIKNPTLLDPTKIDSFLLTDKL